MGSARRKVSSGFTSQTRTLTSLPSPDPPQCHQHLYRSSHKRSALPVLPYSLPFPLNFYSPDHLSLNFLSHFWSQGITNGCLACWYLFLKFSGVELAHSSHLSCFWLFQLIFSEKQAGSGTFSTAALQQEVLWGHSTTQPASRFLLPHSLSNLSQGMAHR